MLPACSPGGDIHGRSPTNHEECEGKWEELPEKFPNFARCNRSELMRALLSSPCLAGETARGSAAEIGTAFVLKSRSSLTKMRENVSFTRGGIRKAGVAGCVAKAECYPSAPVTRKTSMPH